MAQDLVEVGSRGGDEGGRRIGRRDGKLVVVAGEERPGDPKRRVIVNLSGRGDKDVNEVLRVLGRAG